MHAVDIIIRKRDKQELTREEIDYFVKGFTDGEIPDYQAAAWLMAVLLNGMTARETTDLTLAMAYSGEILDLSQAVNYVVDKHSSGGVGDKTTLVVAPLVAACGLPVGKMSGRGLGFSGGTLDKLESIPGYKVNLSTDDFIAQLAKIGIVLTGQSADLAPADGKFYALRDVTGTVQSIPLIASSIMSKKIAAGAHAMVLDVKVGLGAFMENLKNAKELANLMVEIAALAGRKAVAVLSDMNQPLGNAVGNALELEEAIQTLQGSGPPDFLEHCLVLASHMLVLGKQAEDLDSARKIAIEHLENLQAWEKFRQLIFAQGGEVATIDNPARLPKAKIVEPVVAQAAGYVLGINARTVGETTVDMGAGRKKKSDLIDHAVGVILHVKVGDRVEKAQPIFTIHANQPAGVPDARDRLLGAFSWSEDPVPPLPLFYDVIDTKSK